MSEERADLTRFGGSFRVIADSASDAINSRRLFFALFEVSVNGGRDAISRANRNDSGRAWNRVRGFSRSPSPGIRRHRLFEDLLFDKKSIHFQNNSMIY